MHMHYGPGPQVHLVTIPRVGGNNRDRKEGQGQALNFFSHRCPPTPPPTPAPYIGSLLSFSRLRKSIENK